MNLDYVREQVRTKDIDIPSARPFLIRQAGIELRPIAEREPLPSDLTEAWLVLYNDPDPDTVRSIVDRLCRVLADAVLLRNVPDVAALPGSSRSEAMVPGADHILAKVSDQYARAAAVLRALDLLGWVMAYDEIKPPKKRKQKKSS